jgi:hypothetical protein
MVARAYAQLPKESLVGVLKNWLEVAVTQVLINPSLYWLPAGLPFLKLGETKFYHDFPITRMDSVRAGLLRRWRQRLASSTRRREVHAEYVRGTLNQSGVQTIGPSGRGRSVHLRLPVLMRSAQAKAALCRLSVEQGLGISSLYPSSVQGIAELHESLSDQRVPQSAMIAERLVTLPTHELLCDADLLRICEAVQEVHQNKGRGTTYSQDAREAQHPVTELPRTN